MIRCGSPTWRWKALRSAVAAREIEAALAADDVDLAESFVALARERGVAVDRRS